MQMIECAFCDGESKLPCLRCDGKGVIEVII